MQKIEATFMHATHRNTKYLLFNLLRAQFNRKRKELALKSTASRENSDK